MRFQLPADHVFRNVDEQLRCWLVSKEYDADQLVDGTVEFAPGVTASRLSRTGQDGSRTSRVRLIEERTKGQLWTVHVTTHARPGMEPWVLTDVVAPELANENDIGLRRSVMPGTPRFVRLLLDAIPAYDGITGLTTTPAIVRTDDIDTVIDAICDPDRRGLVFVAGTPETFPLGKWKDYVESCVRDTVGLASAYVLDRDATMELNSNLAGHGIQPGCLRTYLPGADPASEEDARRHRFLTTRTLAERPDGYVRRVLGGAARAHVVDQPLPRDVVRVQTLLGRWETEDLLAVWPGPAVVSAAATLIAPAPEHRVAGDGIADRAELYLALHDAVRSVFGDVDADENMVARLAALAQKVPQLEQALARARQALTDRQDEIDLAALDRHDLQAEAERLELDLAVEVEESEALEDKVRYLRKELIRIGHADVAWSGVPVEERLRPPESMSELLERLDELSHVSFTGERDTALELDEVDTLGRSARKAWQALLALDDYASLRATGEYTRNVHEYCQNTPVGCRGWSAERHASDESDTTKHNERYAALRRFPVPPAVNPAGSVFMGAHFKIATIRTLTPRLHYYDDTSRSGQIYVGYLGRHLPNAQSN